MDAIKKKMLAMKMEKENALDRSEQLEQKLRDTEEQKSKIEEDLNTLQKKYSNLENEFDSANEQLAEASTKLEASEKKANEDIEDADGTSDATSMLIGCEEMGENFLSVPEPDYNDNVELSQDSQFSVQDLSQGSVESVPTSDGIKTKKRQGSKKVKKKKSKSKTKDGEKSDKSESKKSRTSRRPEPEGAPPSVANMDEYDRIIYSDELMFSDVDMSADEGISLQKERPERPRSSRPQRQSKNGGIFIPVCSQLGINSNTMIKLAIIGTELQNVVRISLKRVGRVCYFVFFCVLKNLFILKTFLL